MEFKELEKQDKHILDIMKMLASILPICICGENHIMCAGLSTTKYYIWYVNTMAS